jgi:hypothetical protein
VERLRRKVFQLGGPTVSPVLPKESMDFALGVALRRLEGGSATGLRSIVGGERPSRK